MRKDHENRHDDLVEILEVELGMKGMRSLKFVKWGRDDCCGEIDLLAIYPNGRVEFYEVKNNKTENKIRKAKEQYSKFLKKNNLTRGQIPGYAYFGNGSRIEL